MHGTFDVEAILGSFIARIFLEWQTCAPNLQIATTASTTATT